MEVHSADALAISVLQDNYDAWAEEMAKREMLASENQLSDLDLRMDELSRREEVLSSQLKAKLHWLSSQGKPDRAALRASLFLALKTIGNEKREYFARFLKIANLIPLRGADLLRVQLIAATHLLSGGDLAEAIPFAERILKTASAPEVRETQEKCLASTLAGDLYFQSSEYERASSEFKTADSCVQSLGRNWSLFNRSLLTLRLIWSHYRLERYSSTLEFLARGAQEGGLLVPALKPSVSSNLSMILGVVLSETKPQSIPSVWERLAVQSDWVAWGLAKSVSYLVQREQFKDALRWFFSLEPSLSQTAAAEELYRAGLASAEAEGIVDQVANIKFKAISALGVRGHYARSLKGKDSDDLKRRDWVMALFRDFISFKAASPAPRPDGASLLQVVHAVDSFLEENPELCRESAPLRDAHLILSRGHLVEKSERLFLELQSCKGDIALLDGLRIVRLEMFEAMAREERPLGQHWNTFVGELSKELASAARVSEIRRMGFDAVGQAVRQNRDAEGEQLLRQLLASESIVSDEKAFERGLFINTIVTLLARKPQSEPVLSMALLIRSDIKSALAADEPSRLLLESAIAAAYLNRVLLLKAKGSLQQAVVLSLQGASELGSATVPGRDLAFVSMRMACGASFSSACLDASSAVFRDERFSAGERAWAGFLRGDALYERGGYLSAAEQWQKSAESVANSEVSELSAISRDKLLSAGRIFSELGMWNSVLRIRETVERLNSGVPLEQDLKAAFLDWSGRALVAGAWDHAASLAKGLSDPSPSAQKRKERPFLEIASDFFSEAAAARQEQFSGRQIEPVMFKFFEGIASSHVSGIKKGSDFIHLASRVGSDTFRAWQRASLASAERLVRAPDDDQLILVPEQLEKIYLSMLNGCRLFSKIGDSAGTVSQVCSSGISSTFLSLHEGLRARIFASPSIKSVGFAALEKKMLRLEERIRGTPRTYAGKLEKTAGPSFTVLDRSPVDSLFTGGSRW